MNRLFARPAAGQLRRIGTHDLAPMAAGRLPLVIPDSCKVNRWPLMALTGALALSCLALIAERAVSRLHDAPPPPRWTAATNEIDFEAGGQALRIPANLVADASQRAGGTQARIDLVARWPGLTGYNPADAAIFKENEISLVHVWLTDGAPASAVDAMPAADGEALFSPEIYPVAGGLFARAFSSDSAYAGEEIVYEATAIRPGDPTPFAARCERAGMPEATCLRRVALTRDLTMTYRFPRANLADWGRLDRALKTWVTGFLR